MWRSRQVPSGQVYRQLFDAQVQLSRSLLARRGRLNTACLSACLSAEDSNRHSNTTSRLQVCGSSSRGQQVEADVSGLPDAVVPDRPGSDIIERLREKKQTEQSEALDRLYSDLEVLSKDYEAQYRTACAELLSSLGDVDRRLDTLMDRMGELEHVEQFSQQEVLPLWEELLEEVKVRRSRIRQLDKTLTEYETEHSRRITVVLRRSGLLLEEISFSPAADLHRLIHTEAMMINQTLLANRRSVARLFLHLLEENLKKELLLRLRWEESLSNWRSSRVSQLIDGFRERSSSTQQNPAVQLSLVELRRNQQQLTKRRCDIISDLCSLAPPTCSTALLSDWYSQLTAVNQKIDDLHVDFLHQLHCCFEETRQASLERCREALSALQLSEDEVHHIVSSQLLPLTRQCQSQAEQRLAALADGFSSLARHALALSRCVFVLLRGVALRWETHSVTMERREEELQRQLGNQRYTQEQEIQKQKARLDVLLDRLRQESSEEALRASLDKTTCFLNEITHSCRQWAAEQCDVLDRFPALLLDELHSYSSSLTTHFSISSTDSLTEELKILYPSINLEMTEKHPITCQKNDIDSAQSAQDWLTEVDSSLVDLCDFDSLVTFTSRRGGAYTCPAFRCPAHKPVNGLEEETKLALFPVELLTHTLTRVRELFFQHLEQHFHDALSSSIAMVTDGKEALCSEQELQLQLLDTQHIQRHIHNPRQVELLQHRQCVQAHCKRVSEVLHGCRAELQQLQASVSRRIQEPTGQLSRLEEAILHCGASHRLESVYSTLQDSLDLHIKDTQQSQTAFRQSVQLRLQQLRENTAVLLRSFRLFSEGGDFAPQEVELFQKRLEEDSRQIDVTEEFIQTDLDASESRSSQQVKEAFARFEEKFSFLRAELKFLEKIQKVLSNTQVHIKAEAASSNQQQRLISNKLEDLRRLMETTEVSSGQVCSLLSSLSQDLWTRCRHLDCFLDSSLAVPVPQRPLQGSFALAARPRSRKQERLAPPPGLLQPCRGGGAFRDDAVVGVVKALNKLCRMQQVAPEAAETEERGTTAGQSYSPLPVRHKSTESISGQSVRKLCRSNRTDRKFRMFGSKPEAEQNSFRSIVNSLLWKAGDVLLLVAEEFYRKERRGVGRFHFVSDSLDQWAESLNQRLLGYQEQARQYHSTSVQEFVDQLCVLEKLLCLLPGVLFGNHGQHQWAELMEEVGGVRRRLEETLETSEEEKAQHVARLRLALSQQQLQALSHDERRRQERLHDAINNSHQELQERVRVRGEEFVTSLSGLTERFLFHLDGLLTPAETAAALDHTDHCLVTMETGQHPCRGSRTWPGIPFLSPPADNATASCVTMATTASITTAKCTLGHLAVIEQRDAALKRYECVYRAELLRSDADRRRQLTELQNWNTHWELQIHTLTHAL